MIVFGCGHVIVEIFEGGTLDPSAKDALNGVHHIGIVICDQGEGVTALGGTAGAANAMSVGLWGVWDVVIDDVGDLAHINAAGRDIGGDEDLVGAVPKAVKRLLPAVL